MRVLMTADTIGGVWTYAVELIEQFGSQGVEVALATMGRPLSRSQRAEAHRLPFTQVFESRYKLCWMDDPWADVETAGQWLLNLSQEFQPDIVHLNDYPHAALSWNAPVVVVGHSCVLSWHRQVRRCEAGRGWDRYRRAVREGLQAADLVVAPTRAMLGWLTDFYGPLDRCQVIANGRNSDLFWVGHKQPLILTAGRIWDEAKNVAAVVQAARHIPWRTCVAGDQQPPGQAAVPTDPWPEGVRSLGPLDSSALAHWYSSASIYALPARYEPFGLTPLEAALSGCALVLGDLPTLREVWRESAFYVPPDDHVALAQTLNTLIASPRKRRSAAKRARRRGEALTAERMGDSYLLAYAGLLAPRPVLACRATSRTQRGLRYGSSRREVRDACV